jgi:hypothetical protein
VASGQDPKYAKEPAWARKEGEDNAIPATDSHTGEGNPDGADAKPDTADAKPDTAEAEQPAGHTQPAAQ